MSRNNLEQSLVVEIENGPRKVDEMEDKGHTPIT